MENNGTHLRLYRDMYLGPPVDDPQLLDRLPSEYRSLLEQANGYIAYNGGLHIRGACVTPTWHSLREAWEGQSAIHHLYPAVLTTDDIPFAEDALGDQFLLRGGYVFHLLAETGELLALNLTLAAFDSAVRQDPDTFLSLAPLRRFQHDGGVLLPGQLLSVYPPFCFDFAGDRSYRAVGWADRMAFVADLARQLSTLSDGTDVRLVIEPSPGAANQKSD